MEDTRTDVHLIRINYVYNKYISGYSIVYVFLYKQGTICNSFVLVSGVDVIHFSLKQ